MVVVLHLLGKGGVLSSCRKNSINYHISWIMEIGAYCAVDIFALISGYLMVGRRWKIGRIIELWLQVSFYSLGLTFVYAIINPNTVGIKVWIKSTFPVCFQSWWYFTAYFGLFFFIPFLNKLLEFLTKRQTNILIIILITLFSIMDIVLPMDIFQLGGGYSVAWLMALYIIGGSIKKYGFLDKVKKRWFVIVYMGGLVAIWASFIVIHWITMRVLGRAYYVNALLGYTSPLVLGMAVALLLFFNRVKFPNWLNRTVKWTSPLSFSVYIIHSHPLIYQYFDGEFAYLAPKNAAVLVGTILGSALSVFVVCILIECIRTQLFRLLRIHKATKKIGDWIDKKIDFER